VSKFDARYERLRREAGRTAPARDADNDAPRVELHSIEWSAEAIPPVPKEASRVDTGDLEARLARRAAAVFAEHRRRGG
jgi:hypothetical protein